MRGIRWRRPGMKTDLQRVLLGTMIGDCYGSLYEGKQRTEGGIGPWTDDTEQSYAVALWLNAVMEPIRRPFWREDAADEIPLATEQQCERLRLGRVRDPSTKRSRLHGGSVS